MLDKKNLFLLATATFMFATVQFHHIKFKDINDSIVVRNSNPTFTKETITAADFKGAGVTIFTAPWCRYCKGAKILLNQENIPFREVDVEDYKVSRAKLKKIGFEDFYVPQIFVDGVAIGGFSDLKKILGSDMPVPEKSSL